MDAASAMFAIAAVGILGMMGWAMLRGAPAPSSRDVRDWEARLLDPARTVGPAGAPVRIVEFSDFQCPFCRSLHHELAALEDRHPGRIALVTRHFPLDEVHPFARGAAMAAECAREQDRFRPMRDLLFQRQGSLGRDPWDGLAETAAVPDLPRFRECMASRRHQGRIDEDVRLGHWLQLRGTPALVVEGTLLTGVPAAAVLDSLVQHRLRAVAAEP